MAAKVLTISVDGYNKPMRIGDSLVLIDFDSLGSSVTVTHSWTTRYYTNTSFTLSRVDQADSWPYFYGVSNNGKGSSVQGFGGFYCSLGPYIKRTGSAGNYSYTLWVRGFFRARWYYSFYNYSDITAFIYRQLTLSDLSFKGDYVEDGAVSGDGAYIFPSYPVTIS